MSLGVHDANGVLVVQPNRVRITAATGVEDLREALIDAIRNGRLAIAVDLHGVEYADASTIDALIDAYKGLQQVGGSLCIFNAAETLREFFQQTVLHRFIHICSDEQEAVEFFRELPKRKRRRFRSFFS